MQELELTWNRTMRMWWLLVWRMVVGGAILGLFAGALGALVSIFSDLIEYASEFGAVFGYIAGVAWSPFVLRMMLRKKYGDFKLALVPLALTDDYPKL
jgi:hypothetical protein